MQVSDRPAKPLSTASAAEPWRDPDLTTEERVSDLLARMSLREKVAQLYGLWVGADGDTGAVAPHQHDHAAAPPDLDALDRARARAADPAVRDRADRAGPGRPRARLQPASDHGGRPVRHPRDGARGVPDRPGRVEGDGVAGAAVLGGELRSCAGRARWPVRSARRCGGWASTRASRRCSTSSGTCGGDGSRRRSARTPIWWAWSGAPMSGASSARGSWPRSSTSWATRPPAPVATSPRCRSGAGSSRTCSCLRSRWHSRPGHGR